MNEPTEIISSIKNKQITKILAEDVSYEANKKWFNCLSVKLQYLPSVLKHIRISYDWNEIEELDLYKQHKLEVQTANFTERKNDGYNFSIIFKSNFIIKRITLFGFKISISPEINFKEMNVVLFESEFEKVLIAPEENTSRIILTTDEFEINEFLTNLSFNPNEKVEFIKHEI